MPAILSVVRQVLSIPHRQRRYSLRSLFLVMTALCLALGTWSVYVSPFRLQARSLAEVHRLQGKAEAIGATGPTWQRWLVTTLLGKEAFVRVTKVDLAGRNVDNRNVQSLKGLIHLEELRLDHAKITDDGLTVLRSMPELSMLSVRYTGISDRSIEVLRSLPRTSKLILTGTKFSDNAVPELAKLSSLSELYVRWTKITDGGARRLASALPACRVFHHALMAEATIAEAK